MVVRRIKHFEGRMWNSGYYGFVWIHAGDKEPTSKDIYKVESFYRKMIKEEHKRHPGKYNTMLELPKKYPVSYLLGVVYI